MNKKQTFQHLSIRFWSVPGEEVCLILCDPTSADVVGLLDSLAAIADKDAPDNLSALALNCLKPNAGPPTCSFVVNLRSEKVVPNVHVNEKVATNQHENEKSSKVPAQHENKGPVPMSSLMLKENENSSSIHHENENSTSLKHVRENVVSNDDLSKIYPVIQHGKEKPVSVSGNEVSATTQQEDENSESIFGNEKSRSIQQGEDSSVFIFGHELSDAAIKDDPVDEAISSLWCNKDDLITSDEFRMAQVFSERKPKAKRNRVARSSKNDKAESPIGGRKRPAKGPARDGSVGSGSAKTKKHGYSRPSAESSGDIDNFDVKAEVDEEASIKVEISPSDIMIPTGSNSPGSDKFGRSWKIKTGKDRVKRNIDNDSDGADIGAPDAKVEKDEDAESSMQQDDWEASDSNPEVQKMKDQFAFRRKFLQRGVYSAVCPACNRSGYTEWNLRQHLQKMHQYKPCKGCLQLFPEGADHHCPLRNLACDLCPKRFTSLDGWTLHRKKVHRGVLHVCHMCGLQLASVNTLRRHMEVQHGIMPPPPGRHNKREPRVAPSSYFCHKCGKQVKNRYGLRQHERRIHEGKLRSAPCHYCGLIFCTGFSLKRHMASKHKAEMEAVRVSRTLENMGSTDAVAEKNNQ